MVKKSQPKNHGLDDLVVPTPKISLDGMIDGLLGATDDLKDKISTVMDKSEKLHTQSLCANVVINFEELANGAIIFFEFIRQALITRGVQPTIIYMQRQETWIDVHTPTGIIPLPMEDLDRYWMPFLAQQLGIQPEKEL